MSIYFPQFSNLKDYVQVELNNRRDDTLKLSKLNAWVRLTSGVGEGLIIESNPNDALFRAAGQSAGIYDGADGTTATIGKDWNGTSVSAGSGGRLRPRPTVTSVEVDEGAGGISRKATLSITAFSTEQMEKVSEYFLEPGYTVFIEFGWNSVTGVSQLVDINVTNVAAMQNFDNVNTKRSNSKGYYENYLGYVTGGSVSVDGDKWTISVNLTGYTELPFYLQTHKSQMQAIGAGSIDSSDLTYLASDIKNEQDYGRKLFKTMFNDLPAERQLIEVRELEKLFESRPWSFINFDKEIRDRINEELSTVSLNVSGSNVTVKTEGTPVVSEDRFVRLGDFVKILTTTSISSFKLGGVDVKINFSIQDTVISAHKNIFSTDKGKLFIPNPLTPTFSVNGAVGSTTNNAVGQIKFPQNGAINRSSDGVTKDAYEWGYLRDLYINFEFAKDIIGTTNLSIKDVLYQILNGASSAVNSQWDFQIQESPLTDGVINLQIVDLNLVSKTDKDSAYEFTLTGTDSVFIDSSFDMDISGPIMNKVIGERFNTAINPDITPFGFFSTKTDKILTEISRNIKIERENADANDTSTPLPIEIKGDPNPVLAFFRGDKFAQESANKLAANEAERERQAEERAAETERKEEELEATKEKISEFLGKILYLPKLNLQNKEELDRLLNEIKGGSLYKITELCYVGAYNDSNLLDGKKQESETGKTGFSPLLPIKFSFTIHGISGIQRGDKFKVKGIPKTFYDKGFFQVTSIKHIVDRMMWKTQVEGSFRNSL